MSARRMVVSGSMMKDACSCRLPARGSICASLPRPSSCLGRFRRLSGPLRLAPRATKLVGTRALSAEAADTVEHVAPPASDAVVSAAVPEYPVSPPVAAAAQPRSGLPPLVWIIVGVVLAKGFDLVSKLFRGGPGQVQQNMQAMMMQKMMEQMMSGKGGPMGSMDPSSNPFAAWSGTGAGGGASGNPFASAPPPGQQWPQQRQSSPSTFGSSSGFPASESVPATPAYDTTAAPAAKQPAESPKAAPAEPPQSSPPASSDAASQPAPSARPPSRPAFVDVDDDESSSGGGVDGAQQPQEAEVMSGSGTGSVFVGGFQTPGSLAESASSAGNGAGASGSGGGGSTMAMLERMLTDQNLQTMLYPYLPEPMRNPETFKWMLSSPECREQLETIVAQQGHNPAMSELINNFNYDSPELKQQLEAIGMTPEEVLQKIMADPELAMSFSRPEVQEAIMDVTQNQMNITKYSNNPEIMAVFNKMSSMFQRQS